MDLCQRCVGLITGCSAHWQYEETVRQWLDEALGREVSGCRPELLGGDAICVVAWKWRREDAAC